MEEQFDHKDVNLRECLEDVGYRGSERDREMEINLFEMSSSTLPLTFLGNNLVETFAQ